jgi:hypothetical protein
MGVLLTLEMIQASLWLAGVLISGTHEGLAPWGPIPAATLNGLCKPIGLLVFAMDSCIFIWHSAVASALYGWIVRQETLDVLTRRMYAWGVLMIMMGLVFLTVGHHERATGKERDDSIDWATAASGRRC